MSVPAEGEALIRIWRSAVDATHAFVSAADLEDIDAQVRQFLPHEPLWLAVDPTDEPVGFMGLIGTAIDSLFVRADRHGAGAGRALVQFAKNRSPFLTTVANEQNAQGLRFYSRLGFRIEGRSPTDEDGRPYPVLHLKWERSALVDP